MAVEDHPLFPTWRDRLEKLIEAYKAFREGRASQADLDEALTEYNKIADEL